MPEIMNIRKNGRNNNGSKETETKIININIPFLILNKFCLNKKNSNMKEKTNPIFAINPVIEFELPFSDSVALNSNPVKSSK